MNESEALEARLAARVETAPKARRDLATLYSGEVTQADLEGVHVGQEVTLADGVFRLSGASSSGAIDLTSLADEDAEAMRAAKERADLLAYIMPALPEIILGLMHPAPVEQEPAPEPEAPLLPAPDARLADYGPVGTDDITGDLLLDAFEQDEAETAAVDGGIPDAFRDLMLIDETPAKFTERMRRRMQFLKHMQIDGSKPTAARALPDMSDDERAELAGLEERNRRFKWLD